jgi:hypothetical protein
MNSAALTTAVHNELRRQLLRTDGQEDLCFAIWRPSRGSERTSALIYEPVVPEDGERHVRGTVSFEPSYFRRVADAAAVAGGGVAFLHSHPGGRGWQGMSRPDVDTEQRYAPRAHTITERPLIGLTMAGDGKLSARAWLKAGRRDYRRRDFESVRVVGDALRVSWNPDLRPAPPITAAQNRTESTWGPEAQNDLVRLHIGIVGAGSVGAMVAESLVRTGVERVTLIDFDSVETANLDRLLHASQRDADLARSKVEMLRPALLRSATAADPRVEALEYSVVEEAGFRRALDCDVLFSCVDRPWPRSALNYIAYAHLIPVVDVGIDIKRKPDGRLRSALWRAHVAVPGRPCLECLGQYNRGEVPAERDGSFDDESYLGQLPKDHYLRVRQNVFAFSQSAASLAVEQLLRMVVSPGGIANVGPQRYEFKLGRMTCEDRQCRSGCDYVGVTATGETTFKDFGPTGIHQVAEQARLERKRAQRAPKVRTLRLIDELLTRARRS